MKKYELTNESIEYYGRVLYRIKALKDFSNVKAGDLGGFIEREENLSQKGDCWIFDEAKVCSNARVFGHSTVSNTASVFSFAKICDHAKVYGNANISGYSVISDSATILDNAEIFGKAYIFRNATVSGSATVCGEAKVSGHATIKDNATVFDHAQVYGNAMIYENAVIRSDSNIYGNAEVYGHARLVSNVNVSGTSIICGDITIKQETYLKKDALIESLSDYAIVSGFGSTYRTSTFFRSRDGKIKVTCGCFYGTIDEFREQVKKTREGEIAEEYLMIADLMEKHFNCFPKGYKNDQFNYQQGEHNFVETQINFSCTKYESIDINQKAKKLLQNYQILVNSLEFNSGLPDTGDNAEDAFKETKGYDSKDGK